MCKKVSHPGFFSKQRLLIVHYEVGYTHFVSQLQSPNISHAVSTNLVALHIPVGPKLSHHKARVLVVGLQEFWLGVRWVRMTLFLGILAIAWVAY